jgi:hypothetical protein
MGIDEDLLIESIRLGFQALKKSDSAWWLEDQYYRTGLLKKTEIKNALVEVCEIYNDQWISREKNVLSHPLIVYGFPLIQGTRTLNYLKELGSDLNITKKADLLRKSDINRLEDPTQYLGIRFELFILARLVDLQFSIEREPPSGKGNKKADLLVRKGGESIFIELKHLSISRKNKEASHFQDVVLKAITFQTSRISAILNFNLSDSIKVKAKTSEGVRDLLNSQEEIVRKIVDHIMNSYGKEDWGHHIVSGFAAYDLQPFAQNQTGGQGVFSGLPISQESEVQKIFQKAIEEAAGQLPEHQPGIVIIDTPFPVDALMVQERLSSVSNPEHFKHICAVILFFVLTDGSSGQLRYDVILAKNPHSLYSSGEFKVIRDILSIGSNELNKFISDTLNEAHFPHPLND